MFELRNFRPADSAEILDIYAPFIEKGGVTFELTTPDIQEYENRLSAIANEYPFLVAVAHDKVIGFAYACRHRERAAYRWIVETSVYIHAQNRQTGVADALYSELFSILQARNFVWAFAGITLPNLPSVKLHEKFAFEPFALYKDAGWKQDTWHDVVWMRKKLNEASNPPHEPLFIKS